MIIIKQGRKRLEENGSRHCGFQMAGDDGKKPGKSTGNYEQVEHSLKRIWNEYIYQKDKGTDYKQTKVGLNCCQNTHC